MDTVKIFKVMITVILPGMVPMRDITQISPGDRLFYELGRKRHVNITGYKNNWIREGKFKEIEDIETFLKEDKYLTNVEYLEHHNFMLIKKPIKKVFSLKNLN